MLAEANVEPLTSRSGAQTLERGLDLLERIVEEQMTVRDLAKQSGLGLPTTRRLAATLVQTGFLSQNNGILRVGPKLIQLGIRGQGQISFLEAARAPLKALSEATGAPSFLGERDGDYSVHLYRTEGTQRVTVRTPAGTRRKLAETSLGKALLLDDYQADWERHFGSVEPQFRPTGWLDAMRAARARGLVIHDAPGNDGIRAIAAPIRDAGGEIVAGISIVSTAQYLSDAELERVAPLVQETAREISGALGHVER